MNKKLISVIIPCYNVEKWIDRCVRSLVCQSIGIENLELIFVDDASTDCTVDRLKKWEKRFPDSILLITCEVNGKQGRARNIGISYASAPYIGFVDADDWIEEDMYALLYQYAEAEQVEVTACSQGRDCGDGVLRDIRPFFGSTDEKILIQTKEERIHFLAKGWPIGGVVTKLYRKNFLKEKKLFFPEGVAYEDNYFGTLLSCEVSSVYMTDRPLYHYFYNPASTVAHRNAVHQLDRIFVEEELLEDVKERGFFEDYRDFFGTHFVYLYYLNTLHILFTRFDDLQLSCLEHMRVWMSENFPDYKSLSVYSKLSSLEKGFLNTLEVDMTEEKWRNLKENYLYLLSRKEEL